MHNPTMTAVHPASPDRSDPSADARRPTRANAWARRGLRLTAWLLGLWVLLVLLSSLLVPWLAPRLLSDQLSQTLGRPVSIGRMAWNPLNGRLQIEALSVGQPGGGEQLGFARLELNVSARSLTERALVLDAIRLEQPRLSLVRLADGRYDLSDWLDRWLAPSPTPSPAWPRFALQNIRIEGGQVQFEDRPRARLHRAEAITLALPFLSSLPRQADVWVQPRLSAVIDGAQFSLQAQSQPFAAGHRSEVTLALQGLDLAPWQAYLPNGLPLQLQGGSLQTRLHIAFEQPAEGAARVQLSGTAQVRDLALHDPRGQAWWSLEDLALQLDPSEPLRGRYALQALTLSGLQVRAAATSPPLAVQHLALRQADLDLNARRVHALEVSGSNIDLRLVRSAQGHWQWLELAAIASGGASGSAESSGWLATADALVLEGLSLHWQDRTLSPAMGYALTQGELRGQQLSSAPGHANALRLSGRITPSARLLAQGTLQWQPLALDMDVQTQGLPLPLAQPYLTPLLEVTITQGELSSRGQLKLRQVPQDWQASYQGALTLGQVQVVDTRDKRELLHWKALHLRSVDAALWPPRLHLGEVALSDFYARLVLNERGELNLTHILRTPTPSASEEAPTDSRPVTTPPTRPSAAHAHPAWPIQVDRVTLQNGRLDFSDRFIKPHYSASISQVSGSVQHLSSAPGTVAQLALRGQYASNAPVRISARLNPLTENKFLDLQADVSSVDLVDFSPYAGKYAGYTIDKGKLSLNARYTLENRQLRADNRLYIDQLTFGEKVESPSATQLPVHLAIALLKNSQGEIDLHLPIAGSLDDPQFSIGGLIFRMIGNLFVKVLSAPFAFLGSIFGGSEDISQIDFAPGSAALDDAAVGKLQVLARAMRERRDLRLGIAATADARRDAEGLRQAGVERASRDPSLTGQDEAPPPPLTVSEEALRALASARAQAAQAWLIEQGQVPLSRLFLLPSQIAGVGSSGDAPHLSRVQFSLR